MTRLLYELCGKDQDQRFSLFAWRIRLALCQKGLEFTGVPTTFLDKSAFADSGAKTVPVLKDGGKWVADSWDIACYLEDTYPKAPSIFGGKTGRAYAKFFANWAFAALHPRIFLLIAPDIAECLGDEDRAYFLETRAERIGRPVESLTAERDKNFPVLKGVLQPLARTLSEQPFVSGDEPFYPDYVAFSVFQWARISSPLDLLEDEAGIEAWFSRMQDWYHARITKLENPPLV